MSAIELTVKPLRPIKLLKLKAEAVDLYSEQMTWIRESAEQDLRNYEIEVEIKKAEILQEIENGAYTDENGVIDVEKANADFNKDYNVQRFAEKKETVRLYDHIEKILAEKV